MTAVSLYPFEKDFFQELLKLRTSFNRRKLPISTQGIQDNSGYGNTSNPLEHLNILLDENRLETTMDCSKLPPIWTSVVEDTRSDMELAKRKLSTLQKLQQKRLLIVFEDSSSSGQTSEKDIEVLSQDIITLLKKCQDRIRNLMPKILLPDTAAEAEYQTRKNAQQSLALHLQEIFKQFRRQQNYYTRGLEKREDIECCPRNSTAADCKAEDGFSDSVVQEMQHVSHTQAEEIRRIAKSVAELHSLFEELNFLVIEQGTMMDRIDYNIEHIVHQAKQGLHQIEKVIITVSECGKIVPLPIIADVHEFYKAPNILRTTYKYHGVVLV